MRHGHLPSGVVAAAVGWVGLREVGQIAGRERSRDRRRRERQEAEREDASENRAMGAANHDGGAHNKNAASSLARVEPVESGEFAKEFWKARRPRARLASDIFVQ